MDLLENQTQIQTARLSTPLKAIKRYCKQCGETSPRLCTMSSCPLFPLRTGHRSKGYSPLKALRKFCLGCCGHSHKEVRLCPSADCPLFPFRFGKRPE